MSTITEQDLAEKRKVVREALAELQQIKFEYGRVLVTVRRARSDLREARRAFHEQNGTTPSWKRS